MTLPGEIRALGVSAGLHFKLKCVGTLLVCCPVCNWASGILPANKKEVRVNVY